MIFRSSRIYLCLSAPSGFSHTNLINHAGSSKHKQGLPASSWDYQQHSTTFRTSHQPPGLSVTTAIFEQLHGTISQIHHPSIKFSNLQGLSSTIRVCRHLPGTIVELKFNFRNISPNNCLIRGHFDVQKWTLSLAKNKKNFQNL